MSQEYITSVRDMLGLPDGTYRAIANYSLSRDPEHDQWLLLEKRGLRFFRGDAQVHAHMAVRVLDPKPVDLNVDYIAQLQHKDKQIADAKYHGVLAALTALVQEVQKPESKGVITEHTLVALLNKQLEKESHHGKAG